MWTPFKQAGLHMNLKISLSSSIVQTLDSYKVNGWLENICCQTVSSVFQKTPSSPTEKCLFPT